MSKEEPASAYLEETESLRSTRMSCIYHDGSEGLSDRIFFLMQQAAHLQCLRSLEARACL